MSYLYIEAQGCVPVLLENLRGISCSSTYLPDKQVCLHFDVGLHDFLVREACVSVLVGELDFFSLECNEVSSNEL